jgi:hypothetical protein
MNLQVVGQFVHSYLSMQLIQFLTNRRTLLVMFGVDNSGLTDTREADTLARNWYNFLTAGHNSSFPIYIYTLPWPVIYLITF